MNDFITMTCKSCGGKLQITNEIEDFACLYCGTEFLIKREGGIVALPLIEEDIKKVSVSTDITASEFAIIRLKNEIEGEKFQLLVTNDIIIEWSKKKKNEIDKIRNVSTGRTQFFLIVTFLGIFFTIIIIAERLNLDVWAYFFALIIGVVASLFLYKRNPNDIFKRKNVLKAENVYEQQYHNKLEETDPFFKRIRAKENELEKHRKIVEGEL